MSELPGDADRAVLESYLPWQMVQGFPWRDRIGYGLCGPATEAELGKGRIETRAGLNPAFSEATAE